MASPGGVRAGKAYVELALDDAQLQGGLRAAQAKLRRFGDSLSSVGQKFMLAGAAIATPLIASAKYFASAGDEAAKMAKRTGVSVEALTALRYVAEQTGTNFENLEVAFRKMQRSIYDAGNGVKTQADALAELGITFTDIQGLSPEDQFKKIGGAIGGITDPTKKVALAMTLFGKTGTNLLPMFNLGANGIEDMMDKARDFGLVMSSEAAAQAEEFTDRLQEMWATLKMTAFDLGGTVAPAVRAFAIDVAKSTAGMREWIKSNGELVQTILKVSVGVAALGAAGLVIGKIVSGIGFLISVVGKAIVAVKGLALAMGGLTGPGAIVVGIFAIAAALLAVSSAAKDAEKNIAKAVIESQRFQELASKTVTTGDRQRAGDEIRMKRLDQLMQKETRNAAEMREAADIVSQLQSRYGKLGITLATTGKKTEEMAGAWKNFQRAAFKGAIEDLKKARVETEELLFDLGRKRATISPKNAEEWDSVNKQIAAARDNLDAINERIKQTRGEDWQSLLTGTDQAQVIAGRTSVDEDDFQQQAQIAETAERNLSRARLAAIEDENERAIALINDKYDSEMARAKEAASAGDVLAKIELARTQELTTQKINNDKRVADEQMRLQESIDRANEQRQWDIAELRAEATTTDDDERARRVLAIQERQAEVAAEMAGESVELVNEEYELRRKILETQIAQRKEAANQARGRTIEDLKLEALYEGKALEEKRLELEERRAIEAAQAAGENVDLVKKEFAIRRLLMDLSDKDTPMTAATTGSFSAYAASQTGAGTLDKISTSTKQTADNTKRMLDQIEKGQQFA